jgi:hypothetical protein
MVSSTSVINNCRATAEASAAITIPSAKMSNRIFAKIAKSDTELLVI